MATVADIRNASKDQKQTIVDERFANVKPVTNTSGTANNTENNFGQELAKRIGFNVKQGLSPLTAISSAFFPTQTVLAGGKPYNYYEKSFQQDVRSGKYYNQPMAPKQPSSTSGIDAPAPDKGWQPSGLTMGIPLQEQVGVTKRKKR